MIINLPQINTPINLGAPPENLEDIVCESFSKYTEGTREKYTFADKLAYIDMLRDWLHPKSSDDVVRDMFRDYFDYQLDENGDIPDHEDYWSMDFSRVAWRLVESHYMHILVIVEGKKK